MWSGADAKDLKLVDQLGNLDQAVAAAAKRAKLADGYRVWYVEKESSLKDRLTTSLLSWASDWFGPAADDAPPALLASGMRFVAGPHERARAVQRPAGDLRGLPDARSTSGPAADRVASRSTARPRAPRSRSSRWSCW